jgi:tRNA(Arg) A34 adenosine deaminase TadA
MTKEGFMRRAMEIAREGMLSGRHQPFGCVIVKDGEIVGEGCNAVLTNHDPTAHGEVEAIRDACRRLGTWDLSGCDLYTSCEPCSLCVSAMYFANIERLFYAASLGDSAALGGDISVLLSEVARPVEAREQPSEQVLGTEGRALLDEWRKDRNFAEQMATLTRGT